MSNSPKPVAISIEIPWQPDLPKVIFLEELVSTGAAARELNITSSAVKQFCANYRKQTGSVRIANILVGEESIPMIPRSVLESFKGSYVKGAMNGRRKPKSTTGES